MGKPRVYTKGGYDAWECISALQKAIRRNDERLAYYWFKELDDLGWVGATINRLRVMAYEDVGVGDYEAVNFAVRALDQAEAWFKIKNNDYRLAISNAMMALARAKKSRDQTNIIFWYKREIENGWKPPIPDEALDRHTIRGKQKKRGFGHFFDEASRLVSEVIRFDPGTGENLSKQYWQGARDWCVKHEFDGKPGGAPPEDDDGGEDPEPPVVQPSLL